uniref:Large ribosomal subunit protein uL4c n=1 Tax=Platysiphonia delicata TaxID=2006979 RepID=A0A1Z1M0K5_9FLOR|nr:ribosomal protein L4 [Platysiphonia delicata]ARW59628.1 ribosomal protein L4 [Platysiphonia delicata]
MVKKNIRYIIANENNSSTPSYTDGLNISIQETIDQQMYILHKVIKHQLKNLRQGNSHSKTRSEVRGGGKKPWKQKGTGKARAGSNRSPLWKGGGVTFGPRKKIYDSKINKKERLLATKTLIYNKQKKTIIIPDAWGTLEKPSTKYIINKLKNITQNDQKISKSEKILIITEKNNDKLYLSIRNLSYVHVTNANNINLLLLIKAEKILVTFNALKIMKKNIIN